MFEPRKGFTLLELMAVMVIVAIMAGLGAKGYSLARRKAKEGQAVADLQKMRTALEEFRAEFGRYPAQDQLGSVPHADFLSEQVEHLSFKDPWGGDYMYVCSTRFSYGLWSLGQDVENDADNIGDVYHGAIQ